jgi:hypothetical protein
MVCLTHIPRPPLSDFVEVFWHYDDPDPPHARERCLPTGTMEIVINLRDNEALAYDRRNADRPRSFRGPLVRGSHSGLFIIDTAGQTSAMGVHFKPGGAFPFLGSAAELRDALVPREALWGAEAAQLYDLLLDAATVEARFGVLERALLARATRLSGCHPAVAFALEKFRGVPQVLKVSEVGLTPKLFCRIRRFQRVLRLVEHDGFLAFGSWESGRPVAGVHLAFSAPSPEAVEAFHAAAVHHAVPSG